MILQTPPFLSLHSSPLPPPLPHPSSSIPFYSSVLLVGRSRSCGDRKQHARRRFSVLKQKKTKKPHPSPLLPLSPLLPYFSQFYFQDAAFSRLHATGDADTQHTPEMDLKRWLTAGVSRAGGGEGEGEGGRCGWSVNVARVSQ